MSARREFDVVLLGATGYTGEHTARALADMAAPDGRWAGLRWAIAGRSKKKLLALIDKWALAPSALLLADVGDECSLRAMCYRSRLVLNATGPYRFYGEAVVQACIKEKVGIWLTARWSGAGTRLSARARPARTPRRR